VRRMAAWTSSLRKSVTVENGTLRGRCRNTAQFRVSAPKLNTPICEFF